HPDTGSQDECLDALGVLAARRKRRQPANNPQRPRADHRSGRETRDLAQVRVELSARHRFSMANVNWASAPGSAVEDVPQFWPDFRFGSSTSCPVVVMKSSRMPTTAAGD